MLKELLKHSIKLKRKLFIVVILCLVLLSFFPINCFASSSFEITSAHIAIVIDQDKNYYVTETLTADFSKSSRGIYRNIPLISNGHYVKITDVQVVNADGKPIPFKNSIKSKEQILKIGNPNSYVRGKQTYVISYVLHDYNDTHKGFDDAYYNIIGTDWDCILEKVSFSVTFPKDFTEANIHFTSGHSDNTVASELVKWVKKENVILGVLTSSLNPREGLTMRILLADGYFNKRAPLHLALTWFTMTLLMLIGLFALLLFIKSKIEISLIPKPITFTPPKDFNPAELGYFIDRHCDNKDVTSLIYYWASKGFFKIEEINGSIFLTKLKLFLEGKPYEKKLLHHLFSNSNSRDTLEMIILKETQSSAAQTVNIKTLKGDFSEHLLEAKAKIKTFVNSELNPFDYLSETYFRIMKIASFCLLFLLLVWHNYSYLPLLTALLYAAGYVSLVTFIIILFGSFENPLLRVLKESIQYFVSFSSIVYIFFRFAFSHLLSYQFVISPYVVCAILIIAVIFLLSHKTLFVYPHAKKLYGELLGFKIFLQTAEKHKLEALLEENPSYFYDILPYAIVLNITKLWTNKFNALSVQPSTWYTSSLQHRYSRSYSRSSVRSMNSSLYSLNRSLSKGAVDFHPFWNHDSSSNGGGIGFSGGGSSGGGGNSW